MTAFAKPVLITSTKAGQVLERLPLQAGGQHEFNEAWLQHFLFKHPECLPIHEINPQIGTLIPVCCELTVPTGYADILYVTESGSIVLAETKLWRNSEARRTVVAQLLDYAKELRQWSYESLQKAVATTTKNGPAYLLNVVRAASPDLDESRFIDGINRSLRRADILLLVIGDGVRSGAEGLVSFLEENATMQFSFGLVEVAVFPLPSGDIILQPRILAKTEILRRVVYVGPSGESAQGLAAPADEEVERSDPAVKWFESFWTEYLDALKLDDPQQPRPPKPARSTNIYLTMPPGGGSAWVSAFIARAKSVAGVYLTFAQSFDRAAEIYQRLEQEKHQIETEVGEPLAWSRHDTKLTIGVQTSFTALDDPTERRRVIDYLADRSNRFVNAFRDRLQGLNSDRQ